MTTVIEIEPSGSLPYVKADRGVAPVPTSDLTREAPDRHLIVMAEDSLVARASCWWTTAPRTPGERIGAIGHYAAADASAGTAVLERACSVLVAAGCTLAVGPMDGNTWRRYRFVTERGEAPPFVLEPDNPDDWPLHWAECGFTPLATYASAVNDDLSVEDPRTTSRRDALRRAGVSIRPFDSSRGRDELRRIHRLSLAAFAQNFLYTPLDEREFMEATQALLPHVRSELVLMAERDGGLAGFMFAVPDLLQAQRGEPVDAIVLKTMAVDPTFRGLGLGGVLMDDVQQAARRLGYRRAIHALMHEANPSRALSNRYARPIRRYTLFARRLDSR
jgi:GNAT superfamily N-acetyltransferase